MGAAKEHASRAATEMAVAETHPASAAVGVPDDVSPLTTLQGSPPPPPPALATSPLERPYGWSSTEPGTPRSASGEILVQKLTPSRPFAPGGAARGGCARIPPRRTCASRPRRRPAARERSTNRRRSRRRPKPSRVRSRATWRSRFASASASKTIKVDDGRDAGFSKADAEDELGVSSTSKKVIGVVARGRR
jgi:hypothetical protein